MALSDYTGLITSEHADKPKFIAAISALVQPLVDIQAQVSAFPSLHDLDYAVGDQLDAVGKWVGQSRDLTVPLTGVYFSFDVDGLGFDEGTIFGPYDTESGLISLPDDSYRMLLRAAIVANHWDGSIESAYSIWATVFAATGIQVIVQDVGKMSMIIGLLSTSWIDAVAKAMLRSGLLDLRPAGVNMYGREIPSVYGTPFFGFDAQNSSISGFDTGSFSIPL